MNWLTLPSQIHELADPTLMRLVVDLAFCSQANIAAGAVVGLGVIPALYVSTGNVGVDTVPAVAGIPGPITDPNADWAYHFVAPFTPAAVAVAQCTANDKNDSQRISKAKRRLGNDKALLVVVEAAGQTFNFHWHIRALIKE